MHALATFDRGYVGKKFILKYAPDILFGRLEILLFVCVRIFFPLCFDREKLFI